MESYNHLTGNTDQVGPLVAFARRISFILALFFAAIIAIPYFCIYGNIRDLVLRVVIPDRVWIVEDNPFIYNQNLDKAIPPEFPLERTLNDANIKNYYAEVGSVREAEDWLLERGYGKDTLTTEHINANARGKTFPVKPRPGTSLESIINIVVDYGDGDYHMLSYRYPEGKSPFDFSRFKQIKTSSYSVPLPWLSTDGHGSHTWGGHNVSTDFYAEKRRLENLSKLLP